MGNRCGASSSSSTSSFQMVPPRSKTGTKVVQADGSQLLIPTAYHGEEQAPSNMPAPGTVNNKGKLLNSNTKYVVPILEKSESV